MTRIIFLVACVKEKQDVSRLAKDLYISDWFRKAATYAQRNCDAWYILSAKYGLVKPDQVIEPYDVTLNRMPVKARRVWAQRVMGDLRGHLNAEDKVIFLAGTRYRENLIAPIRELGCTVEIPMQGLRFGEQKSWLMKQLGG
jgi:cytoplasmic iron level regulating protein YaaA (DUF328/UPF0246 family)